MRTSTIRLLISCPDARGIVAAVAGFITRHNGNILDADQHTDADRGEFFMRVEIDSAGFDLDRPSFGQAWQAVADRFGMRWRVHWGDELKRVAILVSRAGHCLNDLLWRWRTGELRAAIPLVISNHADLQGDVARFDVPFHHVPVTVAGQPAQEQAIQSLLRSAVIDVIVLARYMQILSPEFVAAYQERIINIHHSFLPAFAGPRPYHQAYERGVKIIGATSHYVTQVLDDGPIIAQATLLVDHRDTADDMVRKGRDLERIVLATALRHHLEDRILVNGNKTVVFD